jgi:uracil-DNA glycosylase family 4
MIYSKAYGDPNAPVTLVFEGGELEKDDEKGLLREALAAVGVDRTDCYMLYAFPTMPPRARKSDRLEGQWVNDHRDAFMTRLARSKSKIIVSFGKSATRAITGKPVKITKARGQAWMYPGISVPVMPCYAPSHVLYRPELADIFQTDLYLLKRLRKRGWDYRELMRGQENREYEWVTDLSDLVANPPELMAVDTETTGLNWYRGVRVVTVQIAVEPGKAMVIPIHRGYWPEMSPGKRNRLRAHLKTLLENPAILKVGHNIAYDHHVLQNEGIEVAGWHRDTMVLAFNADDNMVDKSQDECVRRWVPAMAGYNDRLNRTIDKSDMLHCPREDMLPYGGGDVDACLRLYHVLEDIVTEDAKQTNVMELVQMPALRAFASAMEVHGVPIDTTKLGELATALDIEHDRLHAELMAMVPRKIKRRHMEKGLKFTRPDFLRDILFSEDGLNLTPIMFTPSTADEEDPANRVPSTDAKNHLAYFDDEPFVNIYRTYSKVGKMRSTYVGKELDPKKNAPTGFWQYIENDTIHPSFSLTSTVTGRTSSRNPNGQNFPKRGDLAKAYRKIFRARPGFVLIEADLSQAELRIAAWMAWEETMLRIYRQGGDIHAATAAAVMGITMQAFNRLPKEERDLARFRAKAVNFGFLYGMGWRKFRAYARTDYNLKYTETEAQRTRNVFFDTYPGLRVWHESMDEFVRAHGYVRALHGALRRLPAVHSSVEAMQWSAVRQAVNSPVQRFASDLGLIAMNRIVRDCDQRVLRPILFVHDALVFEAREDRQEEMAQAVRFYMESPPLERMFKLRPPIPIAADVSIGLNLSEMTERKDLTGAAPNWYKPRKDRDLIFG